MSSEPCWTSHTDRSLAPCSCTPDRWASPLADVNKDALSTTYTRYTLPALASTPTASYIRVRPDWLDAASPSAKHVVYLEYRARGWGDAGLPNSYDSKVVVHRVTVSGPDYDLKLYGDTRNELVSWAGLGEGTDLPDYGLYVRAVGK